MYFNGNETDEDFDNLNPVKFVRNTVKKIKKIDSFADIFRSNDKIDCIDEKKSSGTSKKSSRKECRKELGGNIFVRGTKVIALRLPRSAFLGLLALNYRGLASRLERARLNQPDIYNKAVRKWQSLGGQKDVFEKNVGFGKGKKPLACGNKCKNKFDLGFADGYYNVEPVTTLGAGLLAKITASSPILVPILGIVAGVVATKQERESDRLSAENTKDILREQLKIQEEITRRETELSDDETKRNEEKGDDTVEIVKKIAIGSSIIVGILITGAIVTKIVRKKRG